MSAEVRAYLRRVGEWVGEGVVWLALVAGVWWLLGTVFGTSAFEATERALLREMALVGIGAVLLAAAVVALWELRSRFQRLVNPSAAEHRDAVAQWQDAAEDPETMAGIARDPQALARYLGAVCLASAIRAVGRYLLLAVIFASMVAALSPFGASLLT